MLSINARDIKVLEAIDLSERTGDTLRATLRVLGLSKELGSAELSLRGLSEQGLITKGEGGKPSITTKGSEFLDSLYSSETFLRPQIQDSPYSLPNKEAKTPYGRIRGGWEATKPDLSSMGELRVGKPYEN